mgnify:CR=1 FL=1
MKQFINYLKPTYHLYHTIFSSICPDIFVLISILISRVWDPASEQLSKRTKEPAAQQLCIQSCGFELILTGAGLEPFEDVNESDLNL